MRACGATFASLPLLWLLACTQAWPQAPTSPAAPCDRARFRIVLDVGHTATAPGATSARGVTEFEFNKRLAAVVGSALVRDGFSHTWVMISSGDGGHGSLVARAVRANGYGADLFLSLHHDSVQRQYLQSWTVEGKQQLYSDRFSGFSVFVSGTNSAADESVRFARMLSGELLRKGLHFSEHHAEPIRGEGRAFIDPRLGIYRYDGLTVLAYSRAPAALLESGIIVNRSEELEMDSPERRATIASAISAAAEAFCASPRHA